MSVFYAYRDFLVIRCQTFLRRYYAPVEHLIYIFLLLYLSNMPRFRIPTHPEAWFEAWDFDRVYCVRIWECPLGNFPKTNNECFVNAKIKKRVLYDAAFPNLFKTICNKFRTSVTPIVHVRQNCISRGCGGKCFAKNNMRKNETNFHYFI